MSAVGPGSRDDAIGVDRRGERLVEGAEDERRRGPVIAERAGVDRSGNLPIGVHVAR